MKIAFDPAKSTKNTGRLHVMVFRTIPGGIRIISLRRANSRERGRYEKARAT